MRARTAFPIRFWAFVLGGLLIYQFATEATADNCKYEKDIEKSIDLSASELLTIAAAAGYLEISGVPGSKQVVIRGKACSSQEDWLAQSTITTRGGQHARIDVNLPSLDDGGSFFGNNYARMDLHIEVPQDMALEVRDSSGDMQLKNIVVTNLTDSSGDIKLQDLRGPVSIRDSSGDIYVDGSKGDLTIESDSSGDINASDIEGTVLVKRDSSGDIRVSRVSEDVVVEWDSSGDISATDVGGDFRVLKDGSGRIQSDGITGEIQIPEKR